MAPEAKLVKPAVLMRLRTRQLASAPWRSLYQLSEAAEGEGLG